MHVIQVAKTDLFALVDSVPQREFIVAHGCNAQGKMGAGFAKGFAQRYPSSYKKYVKMLDDYKDQKVLGMVSWDSLNENMMFTASIITQEFYGKDRSLVYANQVAIIEGLCTVITFAKMMNLDIYAPLIGAGYGGLSPHQSIDCFRKAVRMSNARNVSIGNVNKMLTICTQ